MYSPGNSVIVNTLMRWPALIPVAVACCVAAVVNDPPKPVDPPAQVIVAPAPAPVPVVEKPKEVLPVIKKAPRG